MTYWRSATVNGMTVVAGGSYRHKKTDGVYQVGCIARMEADLTPVAVYAKDAQVWIRPLAEFCDGRFEPCAREAREPAPAGQGNAKDQRNLGHSDGLGQEGVPQDFVRAYMWLSLAGSNTINALNVISERMSSTQLAEAQRLAREWKPMREAAAGETDTSNGSARPGPGVADLHL